MSKEIKLFTDSDLDGISCGIIAELLFGDDVDITYTNPKMIEKEIDTFIANKDSSQINTIYVTDLSVPNSVANKLQKLYEEGYTVKLMDHHRTSFYMNKYKWAKVAEFFINRKTCGAELFLEYLKDAITFINKDLNINFSRVESYVEYVRLWDTWEWTEDTTGNGLIAKKLNTLLSLYSDTKFIKETKNKIINDRDIINDFENKLIEVNENKKKRYLSYKLRTMRKINIDKYNVGVVFAEEFISELGNYLCRENEDIDFVMMIQPDIRVVSLRTIKDDVDLSAIAKTYGGGGHPKSAGFVYNTDLDINIINSIIVRNDSNG